MSGTKYRGTALYVEFVRALGAGTVVLTAESRTFEVQQQSNQIDVTVRSDSAKSFLPDVPAITATMEGLDTVGTVTGGVTAQLWDRIQIADSGTLVWAPEGTAAGNRKNSMPAITRSKNFSSPYDQVSTWRLEWDAQGGSVVNSNY